MLLHNRHPIAFFSKALGSKHLQLATYKKDLLAIVVAIYKWKGYLLHKPFIIKTSHQALKYMLEQRECNPHSKHGFANCCYCNIESCTKREVIMWWLMLGLERWKNFFLNNVWY